MIVELNTPTDGATSMQQSHSPRCTTLVSLLTCLSHFRAVFGIKETLMPDEPVNMPVERVKEPSEDRALWFDLMLTSEDREWMEQIEAGFREVQV
jgi:hypothetical protein